MNRNFPEIGHLEEQLQALMLQLQQDLQDNIRVQIQQRYDLTIQRIRMLRMQLNLSRDLNQPIEEV